MQWILASICQSEVMEWVIVICWSSTFRETDTAGWGLFMPRRDTLGTPTLPAGACLAWQGHCRPGHVYDWQGHWHCRPGLVYVWQGYFRDTDTAGRGLFTTGKDTDTAGLGLFMPDRDNLGTLTLPVGVCLCVAGTLGTLTLLAE